MTLEVKNVALVRRDLQAVHYTEENAEAVRQWIQDNSTFQEIVRDPNTGRMYIPSPDGVDIAEYGEHILFDPVDRAFRSTTEEAYSHYYEEV